MVAAGYIGYLIVAAAGFDDPGNAICFYVSACCSWWLHCDMSA